ncbi:hypothetical protein ACFY3N_11385 [Streptomyces sp. NPDC000348]|uniref:hypothetical protein n=1 Tax=Streptomyces sp. NPDC000348 TaxID=3364538 RepID=UPI0036D17727
MGHVESAHLWELALGHTTGDEDAGALRHVSGCPRCRAELKLLTRVVKGVRDAEAADLPAAPSERVWQRIVEELSHEAATPPPPGGCPGRRSPAGTAYTVRHVRTAGAGTRACLLGLVLVAGVALLRRFRVRTRAGAGG